jgi:hypothetical protein
MVNFAPLYPPPPNVISQVTPMNSCTTNENVHFMDRVYLRVFYYSHHRSRLPIRAFLIDKDSVLCEVQTKFLYTLKLSASLKWLGRNFIVFAVWQFYFNFPIPINVSSSMAVRNATNTFTCLNGVVSCVCQLRENERFVS